MDTPSPIKIESGVRTLDLELNVYYYGTEDCEPGHRWGPLVRDHFVLHIVGSGEGRFESGGKELELGKGSCFLIRPGVKTAYAASKTKPWSYKWIGFNGSKAESAASAAGFAPARPAIQAGELFGELKEKLDCFERASSLGGAARPLAETSALYGLLSILARAQGQSQEDGPQVSRRELHIQRAMEYIERNHSRELSIDELARHVGVDRTHLAHMFKLVLNSSPSAQLIALRIKKAAELLESRTDLSVKEIACSVGYRDPLLFSKTFRKLKGLPPVEFRRRRLGA